MIEVDVVRAWPRRFESLRLKLPPGSTVVDALAATGWTGPDTAPVLCAIHGQRADGATVLHDGDRVELLRPLVADPKDARRRRADRSAGR